jgi:hypothetical protein
MYAAQQSQYKLIPPGPPTTISQVLTPLQVVQLTSQVHEPGQTSLTGTVVVVMTGLEADSLPLFAAVSLLWVAPVVFFPSSTTGTQQQGLTTVSKVRVELVLVF